MLLVLQARLDINQIRPVHQRLWLRKHWPSGILLRCNERVPNENSCVLAGRLMCGFSINHAVRLSAVGEAGRLRCNVAGGLGLVITSAKPVSCIFTSVRGHHERYLGVIRRFGLDIGATDSGILAWAVFAPTRDPGPGALAGEYAGVGASATVVAGVGANALV